LALLGGAVLGAAAMYLLDPETGRRRRERLSESAGDAFRATGETIAPALEALSERARDLGHRLSDRAGDAGESVRDRSSDAYDSARGAIGGAYDSARDTVSGWAESLGGWGRRFGRRASRRASTWTEAASDRASRLNPWREQESHATAYTVAGISAAALGAGLIYLLDPTNGRRRRAAAANAVSGIVNDTGRAFRSSGRYVQDLVNRGRGVAHETRRRFGSREPVSAEQLLQRVRSEMGHVVSHAGAIQVMADGDGVVTLSGRVLASEVDPLLTTVNKVTGVSQVVNRLDVQDTVEGVTEQAAAPGQRL
jgi:gas vesicle protein